MFVCLVTRDRITEVSVRRKNRQYRNTDTIFFNTGVLQERYITSVLNDAYFSSITEDMNTTWKNKNGGKSVKETFDEYIVKYMGEPMKELLRYNSC